MTNVLILGKKHKVYFKFIWKRKTRVRAAVTMFGVQAVSKYCFPSAGSLSHFVISHGWYSSIHFIHLDRKGPSELSRLSNILRDLGAASWDVGIFSLKSIALPKISLAWKKLLCPTKQPLRLQGCFPKNMVQWLAKLNWLDSASSPHLFASQD